MRATLHVARELRLPIEAVSETFAILAKLGVGARPGQARPP
jgi:hypothetical protein